MTQDQQSLQAVETGAPPAVRGHVLVVDDNRVNRLKLARAVEQQGHAVEMAEDGARALELLGQSVFDVVLLDIVMPGMDGFEVLERIRMTPAIREIPVIVVSAIDDMESVVRSIEMGAEDYVPKPFNTALLRARLTTTLERKRLRDLERAYLQQELTLRQNEKLATLGRLSAGLAHELNNPASAVLRASRQLRAALGGLNRVHHGLHSSDAALHPEFLRDLEADVLRRLESPAEVDAITRGRLEDELEDWLDAAGIAGETDAVPSLAAAGYGGEDLDRLASEFAGEALEDVLSWLCAVVFAYGLLDEVQTGATRISDVIGALKTYSYMDRAPLQSVDVHEGLDDTLTMLKSRLDGIAALDRAYAADLPRITAWGNELNQVWTHLLENAIDAVAGNDEGRITIRTRPADGGVVIEVDDNGPGVPIDILPRIFDPFFTTKPPGHGVGLGLTTAHTIVAQKHGGEILASSAPGLTRFTVRLPLTPPGT